MRASAATSASVLLAAVAMGVLAGCGSAAQSDVVARACRNVSSGVVIKLVLSNLAPKPRVRATKGARVEVVSSYHGHEMTFPAAGPSTAVCKISEHRDSDGAATVVYQALRPTTVTFSSTYTHATQAMMPAMLGRLVVVRR